MSGAIFSDTNMNVHVDQDESGILCTFDCWACDTRITIRHPWPEVRRMLEGHQVPGIVMNPDGWQIEIECTNYSDGCSAKNRYLIRHNQLEEMAEREASRRQRLASAGRRY